MIWININLEALPQEMAARIIDPVQPDKVIRLANERAKAGKSTFVYENQRFSMTFNNDIRFVHYSDVLVCKYNRDELITTMSLSHFKKNYPYENINYAD